MTTSEEDIAKMKDVGLYAGIAFQIKDDLFDYGDSEVGKPLGIDIREKKMTLPLIYTLQKASWTEKRRSINIIRRHNENRKKVDELIAFVKKSGGIKYATEVMNRYYQEAKDILMTFPDSEYRQSLLALVEYTIERKR